jgi:glycosyltransferase involved in cell wall biosynthesis
MKILFLSPYPFNTAPSQRFRFEQYFDALRDKGINFQQYPFYNEKALGVIYSEGRSIQKILIVVTSCLKRIIHLFKIRKSDFIFIHREVAPVAPPVFEWIIARIFRKKIIYDFDDAIWLTDMESRNRVQNMIRSYDKVGKICKWSYKVSCGNEYLREFALKHNQSAIVNPTTVDTDHLHSRVHGIKNDKVVLGWTGTHSTLKYLYRISDVLQRVVSNGNISILIICNRRPQWEISDYTYIDWSRNNEIDDLLKIDIGLMPLPDDPWTRGKCGFKAIQYLALGIPAVVTPLEMNRQIVDHGVNGYYCSGPEEWVKFITELANDPAKRIEFGKNGREKIIKNYSLASNLKNFLRLFE